MTTIQFEAGDFHDVVSRTLAVLRLGHVHVVELAVAARHDDGAIVRIVLEGSIEHLDQVTVRISRIVGVTALSLHPVDRDDAPTAQVRDGGSVGPAIRMGDVTFLREKGITGPMVPYIPPDFDDPLPEDFLLRPLPPDADR